MAPCLTRPSVPMILTIASIMDADVPAMQVKFQPQAIAYPTYMQDKHIFVVETFLMKRKDILILHG